MNRTPASKVNTCLGSIRRSVILNYLLESTHTGGRGGRVQASINPTSVSGVAWITEA